MAKQVVPSELPDTHQITTAETLGKLIRAHRTRMKMKLVDCAALCGIGTNTLSRIESGNPNCTLGATFAVMQGLGIKLTTSEQSADYQVREDWV